MPDDQARDVGVRLGATYPRPIVDLAQARAQALAAFRSAQVLEADDAAAEEPTT
jgi:deoxyribodipyrimidine photolyase